VNQIKPNPKLRDKKRKFKLKEIFGVSGRLVTPCSTNQIHFTNKRMRFYSYSEGKTYNFSLVSSSWKYLSRFELPQANLLESCDVIYIS
jgi:hypothetical protein